jgi:cyanophycinase
MKISEPNGRVFVIGGGEDRSGDCEVLQEFVKLSGRGKLAVMTVASTEKKLVSQEYVKVFKRFGRKTEIIDVETRLDANSPEVLESIESTSAIFFTGGDQLRITSLLGGTLLEAAIRRKFRRGHLLGGTSAGASMMSNSIGPFRRCRLESETRLCHYRAGNGFRSRCND